MRSIGILVVAVTIFIVYLTGNHAQKHDCPMKVNWPAHYCPDGEGFSCWRDVRRRDINCQEFKWGNKTEFPNTRGFGWCYCCGRCRLPENILANNQGY